jgi:hypothetical protein
MLIFKSLKIEKLYIFFNQKKLSVQDSKNLTEKKKQQQKHRISLKSFRESRHAMLVLALQNLLELSPFRRQTSYTSSNFVALSSCTLPLQTSSHSRSRLQARLLIAILSCYFVWCILSFNTSHYVASNMV